MTLELHPYYKLLSIITVDNSGGYGSEPMTIYNWTKPLLILWSIGLLVILPQCIMRPITTRICCYHSSEKPRTVYTPINPTINVWIHGTLFGLSPTYRRPFLTKPQLLHMHTIPKSTYVRMPADILTTHHPDLFPDASFYLFCWSGRLSLYIREQAADILYKELKIVRANYRQKYKQEPSIRIFGHSHGGNIALALARNITTDLQDPLYVHELILLACPVQERSYPYIKSTMFERIFSLYSSLDFVQICAPQLMLHKASSFLARINWFPFSKQVFPDQENLVQTKIKMNKRALTHGEFVSNQFFTHFAAIRHTMIGLLQSKKSNTSNKPTIPSKHLLSVHTSQIHIPNPKDSS